MSDLFKPCYLPATVGLHLPRSDRLALPHVPKRSGDAGSCCVCRRRGFGAVVLRNNKHSRLAGIVCADVDTRGAAAAGRWFASRGCQEAPAEGGEQRPIDTGGGMDAEGREIPAFAAGADFETVRLRNFAQVTAERFDLRGRYRTNQRVRSLEYRSTKLTVTRRVYGASARHIFWNCSLW